MFKKWTEESEGIMIDDNGNNGHHQADSDKEKPEIMINKSTENRKSNGDVNTILKGSKLVGDINVTCDLKLSGDVEGNITSEGKSDIVIQGICKGNIITKEGSVDIEGELVKGNITAGKNVTISGKFKGGEAKAEGKIYVNGAFNGKLEANEIEIGPNASGKGELLYREYISIAKGAKLEAQISQVQNGLKVVKDPGEKKVVEIKAVTKEIKEVK
jgi:cytoskeletal protein CcmA (bactofilin family)